MPTPILSVRGLSKGFYLHERGRRVPAARPISFDVAAGELVALTGPSGAGKSSLLKAIYRTYRPSAGRLLYRPAAGETVDLVQASEVQIIELRRREIGFVTQFLQCLPRLSTLDLVARPLVQRGLDRDTARARARTILAALALPEPLWDIPPATFSGGERQRVNIARSLVARPRLLLLDEPTASLDLLARERVLEVIRAELQAGTAMVAIFHDPQLVEQLATRIVPVEPAALEAPP